MWNFEEIEYYNELHITRLFFSVKILSGEFNFKTGKIENMEDVCFGTIFIKSKRERGLRIIYTSVIQCEGRTYMACCIVSSHNLLHEEDTHPMCSKDLMKVGSARAFKLHAD